MSQVLMLLPKSGKQLGDPASCTPTCLLGTLGKFLKRIHKGKSTLDAIRTVVENAEKASKQQRRGERYVVITIDVKNAFNNVGRWEAIAVALHMRVPD